MGPGYFSPMIFWPFYNPKLFLFKNDKKKTLIVLNSLPDKWGGGQKGKQEAHGPHCSPEEDFYMFSISFYKLAIISPCRRAWLFI